MDRTLQALVMVVLALAAAGRAHAQSANIAERYLFTAINEERISRGMAPVTLDVPLHRAALAHTQQMALHQGIAHRFPGELELSDRGSAAGARFARISEYVAEGPTAVIVHDAWMHSPSHRANILDPAVNAVGIAVVARNGQLYAVEDFQSTVPGLTFDQQETTVALLLDFAGLDLVPDPAARETCAMSSGYAGEESPSFVVRFTTGDLSRLPSQLRARLAAGKDRRAAVGACRDREAGAFSTYRLAVVLYP